MRTRDVTLEELADRIEDLGPLERCIITLAVLAFERGDKALGRALCAFEHMAPATPDDELIDRCKLLLEAADVVIPQRERFWWLAAVREAFGDLDYSPWAGPVVDLLQRRVAS